MFPCIPQISISDLSQYLPDVKKRMPERLLQLSGMVTNLMPSLSFLETIDKLKADIRPLCRSVSILTKGMELWHIAVPGNTFIRAISVLGNASAVFDLAHIGCGFGYVGSLVKRFKEGEWTKTNGEPNHFVEVAFGLVATSEILSFADKNNLIGLGSLAVAYGYIPLSLGTILTVGLIVGFSALTYDGVRKYLRITDSGFALTLAKGEEWDAPKEESKTKWNTVWAASELALIVIPMVLPIPKFAQLTAGIIAKGIGIKAHLLNVTV